MRSLPAAYDTFRKRAKVSIISLLKMTYKYMHVVKSDTLIEHRLLQRVAVKQKKEAKENRKWSCFVIFDPDIIFIV